MSLQTGRLLLSHPRSIKSSKLFSITSLSQYYIPLLSRTHDSRPLKQPHLLANTIRYFSNNSVQNRYYPRRAIMYIPSSDLRKIQKIPSLNVDTVVIDFEDGVAANQKDVARSNVTTALSIASQCTSECVLRVNGVDSGEVSRDLQAIFMGGANDNEPDALMLPKCENTEHLKQLDFLVGYYRNSLSKPRLPLHIIIESPSSLLSLKEVCQFGIEKLRNLILEVIIFGSDDFLAALGGQRTEDAKELMYARQSFVTQVKSLGLQAIDLVSIDYKNLDALKLQSEEGSRMGFTGKQIIHPGQISTVQSAFTPSKELIEWAEGLIASFKEHEASGKGAFTYRDKMIDRPLLLQAENLVRIQKILSQ